MRKITNLGVGFTAALVVGVLAGIGGAQDKATYVGDSKCMMCHSKQVSSWKKTKLFKSLDALKPTGEADKALFEAKKKAGLDPAKDYSGDAACLKCHTTGYGLDGGYPAKLAPENEKVAKSMGSVSCEACHGPASVYLEYKKKKKDEAKKEGKEAVFTKEEFAKVGLVTPTEENCKTCHNKDNPTNASDTFKWDEAKLKVHDHIAK
jgi:hypothetical protein